MLYARRLLFVGGLLFTVHAAIGCGSGTAPTVKVTGTVTYNDKPVAGAGVNFTPSQGRSADGITDKDGKFTLSTFKPEDGAVLGTHKVVITAPGPANADDNSPEAIAAAEAAPKPFPPRYSDANSSGFTADVKKGQANDFQFKMVD